MKSVLKFGVPIKLRSLVYAADEGPANPENGALFYNSDAAVGKISAYLDGSWQQLATQEELDVTQFSIGECMDGDGGWVGFGTGLPAGNSNYMDGEIGITSCLLALDARLALSSLDEAYKIGGTITTQAISGPLYGPVVVAGTESLNVTAAGGLQAKLIKLMDGSAFVQETYKAGLTLTDNSGPTALSALSFAFATYCASQIEYTIQEAIGIRTGRIFVVCDGSTVSITDDYTETGDVGVTWTSAINGTDLEVKYTTTNLTGNRTMQANIKLFQSY
jgi:hypothetical protein